MARGDTLTVLNPMGFPPAVTRKELAPRLATLDGKTIYLVDCRFDDSDVFLEPDAGLVRATTCPACEHVVKPHLERLPRTTIPRPGRRSRRRDTPPSSASATEAPARRRSPRTR